MYIGWLTSILQSLMLANKKSFLGEKLISDGVTYRYIQCNTRSKSIRNILVNSRKAAVIWCEYSVTCLNRIQMGPNILSGLDRIRITQTGLFVKNFCIVVTLIIKCAYYWIDYLTYSTSFQLLNLNPMLKCYFYQTHFQTKTFFSIITPR